MDSSVITDQITGTWGPAALLATVIILLLTGKLVTKRTKDELISAQKDYFEGRISDIKASYEERLSEMRNTNSTLTTALQGAVSNVSNLISQVDELQELTRVATPAIVAARQAAENDNAS